MKGSDPLRHHRPGHPQEASTKGCPVKGSDRVSVVGGPRIADASTKGCPVKGSDSRPGLRMVQDHLSLNEGLPGEGQRLTRARPVTSSSPMPQRRAAR